MTTPPTKYDPNSPDEQPITLPSAPIERLNIGVEAGGAFLQPPLTRRGFGPGIVVVLTSDVPTSAAPYDPTEANKNKAPLDPPPVQKWAEEGFAVVAIYSDRLGKKSISDIIGPAIDSLVNHSSVDIKDKFGLIVYDAKSVQSALQAVSKDPRLSCFMCSSWPGDASLATLRHTPTIVHAPNGVKVPKPDPSSNIKYYTYESSNPNFIIPGQPEYHAGSANVAHTRSLVFLRKHIGGPHFDIEAIWEEHTYFEFVVRSLAKTMGTMVAEPYVNHVPTVTGGMGRKDLTAFYRDHFIFSNPLDMQMETISRTVGPDRVIDEFIMHFTHDQVVDWLLPQCPPTNKKVAVPMISVVNVRGDRLYHEHIWWDQSTIFKQIGLIPSHVDSPNDPQSIVRLPVAGAESATLLADENRGDMNFMFGKDWGVSKKE